MNRSILTGMMSLICTLRVTGDLAMDRLLIRILLKDLILLILMTYYELATQMCILKSQIVS